MKKYFMLERISCLRKKFCISKRRVEVKGVLNECMGCKYNRKQNHLNYKLCLLSSISSKTTWIIFGKTKTESQKDGLFYLHVLLLDLKLADILSS